MNTEMPFEQQCSRLVENQGRVPDPDRLQKLFSVTWVNKMANEPETSTEFGFSGYDDRWSDLSFEAIERRKCETILQLKVLESIERKHLSETDQISYDLFKWALEEQKTEAQFGNELMPLTQMNGIQQDSTRIVAMMTVNTAEQIENILSRLERFPVLVEQTMELIKKGIAKGITPPRITLADVPDQIKNQITTQAEDAPILAGFKSLVPPEFQNENRAKKVREAYKLYIEKVSPAFRIFHEFIEKTYLPKCREEISWEALPNGEDWYEWLVQHHTTTKMTPDEIFEVGQSEVTRIRAQMDTVIEQTGFKGGFSEFCEFLRTDPMFYFNKPSELLVAYRDISKRIDPELIRFFGKLPVLPYGVIPIPSYAEKSQTTAYYQPGSLQAGRPGYFYANTYNLKARPKWEMEALTLHEAVPGHHLHIAINQELEGLPEFRKNMWITSYGEGWALYAESLGEQMGFYQDPYSKFGQLTYEMWRAIRLVVDPGMHAKGWSRQQAIDFFAQNSGKTLHDIKVEIDRYIVWPGQALAYKIGELRIKKLRVKAEKELGENFDIRGFHDEILSQGCLPLDLLDKRMKHWIDVRAHT
jgi:uncharacterized protein (DUF885 family)